jgi:hypothetical protein
MGQRRSDQSHPPSSLPINWREIHDSRPIANTPITIRRPESPSISAIENVRLTTKFRRSGTPNARFEAFTTAFTTPLAL